MTYSPGQSSRRVPSALSGLTSGFGMGPGVPLTHRSPRDLLQMSAARANHARRLNRVKFQVLRITFDELSPRPLDTSPLRIAAIHVTPIKQVVYLRSYSLMGWEI